MLSIVIVNYRSWDKLTECLSALKVEHNSSFQVIVVDNNSNDGYLANVTTQFPNVAFIENSGNWGFAQGCNLGAKHSQGNTLLFLNPDTIAEPQALLDLLAIKTSEHIGLLTCRQVDGAGNNQKTFGNLETFWTSFSPVRRLLQRLKPGQYPSPRIDHPKRIYVECLSGSMIMISREDFDRLGGWDERFWMYAEDADLCKRAAKLGLSIAYEPSVTITHFHGGASRMNPETKALTKSEVIISRHVFNNKHQPNRIYCWGAHCNTFIRRSLPIFVFALLSSPLLLGRSRNGALRKASHLVSYYGNWLRSGDCRSIRAIRN